MSKFSVLIFLIGIFSMRLFATQQREDKVIYRGKTYFMPTFPMNAYFEIHPEKKPSSDVLITSLWRGHVATYEFKENALFLKDIEVPIERKVGVPPYEMTWKSVMSQVVPKGKRLPVDWHSGILVLSHGKFVDDVDGVSGMSYSKYLLLEVKKGKITGRRRYDLKQFKQFKEQQFQAYKKTDSYRQEVAERKQQGDSQAEIDSQLKYFIMNFTSEFLFDPAPSKTSEAGVSR